MIIDVDAIQKFIGDLALHFSTPKHGSTVAEAAWLKSMVAELRGYSPEVLDRAARRIITTRKYRNFPLVAECRQACRDVAGEIEFDKHVQTLPTLREATGTEWSTERVKLAYDLCKGTQVGKEAARDGWVLSLWDFVRKHQRVPKGSAEIEACRRGAKEFDEAYAKCVKGGWAGADQLVALGSSMLAKREKLSAEVLGKPDIPRTA